VGDSPDVQNKMGRYDDFRILPPTESVDLVQAQARER
jgi:hypothetical protein